jgi:hypothetical protein
MHILIFKTNIETDDHHKEVSSVLSSHPLIINWHIDKEDIDKVLRIESTINNSIEIISTINQAGFKCEELAD